MAAVLDLGTLAVKIKADGASTTQSTLGGVNTTLKTTEAQASKTTLSLEKMASGLNKLGNNLTLKVTTPIIALGAAAFKMGSDLEETINKVDVVFKENAETIKDWSETSLQKMGMAKQSAMDMAALFGDMGSGMGLNSEITLDYAKNLTQLSADMASFKNVSIDRAQTALTGIYTGETEALKGLGVVMTEANLQTYAYSQGIKTKVKDMEQAEKVQLRYNYVMSVTSNAHGDFERTSDGAANQMRIFTESLKELGASFSEVLLPAITPMITKANELIQKFAELDTETKGQIVNCALIVAAIGPAIKGLGGMATAVNVVSKAIKNINLLFSPWGLALAAIGVAIGGLCTVLYNQYQEQKRVNEEIEKTLDLQTKGIAVSQESIEQAKSESDVLEQRLNAYTALNEKVNENTRTHAAMYAEIQKLKDAGDYLGAAKMYLDLVKLKDEGNELSKTLNTMYTTIKEQYGTLENAEERHEAYGKAISDAEKNLVILNSASDEISKTLAKEAIALSTTANEGKILTQRYEELVAKQGDSKEASQQLEEVKKRLISLFGSSVVEINKETGEKEINIEALNREVIANGALSEAKMIAVQAYIQGGKEAVEAQREETTKKIELLKLEQQALLQTQRMEQSSTNRLFERAQMGASVFDKTTNSVNAFDKESIKLGNDINNLNKDISQNEQTLTELDSILAQVSATTHKGGQESEEAGKKATKSAGSSKAASKSALDSAIETYEQKKDLGEMSLIEEVKVLDEIKAKHSTNAQDIIKINEFAQEQMKDNIQRRKEQEELTLEEEIKLYEHARDNFCTNATDKAEFNKLITQAVIEDARTLTQNLNELGKEELYDIKEKLEEKKLLYKEDKLAAEEIDKEILATKKEIYDEEVLELSETVDELIEERKRQYQEEKDLLDEKLQEALNKEQDKLDAMDAEDEERRIKDKEDSYSKALSRINEKMAKAEDSEEIARLQEEYREKELERDKWRDDEKRKAERKAIKESQDDIRADYKEKQDLAKDNFDKDVKNIEEHKLFQEEVLKQKMIMTDATEQEITANALKSLGDRENDLTKSMEEQKRIYQNQIPIIASIGGDYGDKLLEGLMSTEGLIDSFISRKMNELESAINGVSFGSGSSSNKPKSNAASVGRSVNSPGSNPVPQSRGVPDTSVVDKLDQVIQAIQEQPRTTQRLNRMGVI